MHFPPVALLFTILVLLLPHNCSAQQQPFINEFHYENASNDENEQIEIVAPVNTDLTEYTIELYNGFNGQSYRILPLSGTPDSGVEDGFGTKVITATGLQNGAPDGIALFKTDCYPPLLLEFISYEGVFTATNGLAAGQQSTDIGVSESITTPIGQSLQLNGSFDMWVGPIMDSFESKNAGQSFSDLTVDVATCPLIPKDVFINEIHYENSGNDENERIEIVAPAGTDLSLYSIYLYSESDGAAYDVKVLTGTPDNVQDGFGTKVVATPGIQNGPDGIALVRNDCNPPLVLEFISYEGSGFTATDGPAITLTSTDIGERETASTPSTSSLQLDGSYATWTSPAAETFDGPNDGPSQGQNFAHLQDNVQACPNTVTPPTSLGPFINEFHYTNSGEDSGEFIEIAVPDGTDLNDYNVVLYNGENTGQSYETVSLSSGTVSAVEDGFRFVVLTVTGDIQNGGAVGDGIALVRTCPSGEDVVQFISYSGPTFMATNGPANGETSSDIFVVETEGNAAGLSLYVGGDFTTWKGPLTQTMGAKNQEQDFSGVTGVLTNCPSEAPSSSPSKSSAPSLAPSTSSAPSLAPSKSSAPSLAPSRSSAPSLAPSKSSAPSLAPSKSSAPSLAPSKSSAPSFAPSSSKSKKAGSKNSKSGSTASKSSKSPKVSQPNQQANASKKAKLV